MKVVSVVGARPQFIKLGAIARACADRTDIEHHIIHTGQHYDPGMSSVFFDALGIPSPDVNLGVGSGSHGEQTGAMLRDLEPHFDAMQPDWVLVYGDTNSTLAAALAAVKKHHRVAHLEAGLRSFNRRMPEEHNRVLTDHAADLLLAPTQVAMDHLATEGLASRSVLVGDVMTDVCYATRDAVQDVDSLIELGAAADQPYVVATIHRPDNTDTPERLASVLSALQRIDAPTLLVAHPRLVAAAATHGIPLGGGQVQAIEPLDYPQMVQTVTRAAGVVTDSGGLQKEAYLLGTPCVTVRPETEWVETLEDGWNILDPDLAVLAEKAVRPRPTADRGTPYGDGQASRRTLEALLHATHTSAQARV